MQQRKKVIPCFDEQEDKTSVSRPVLPYGVLLGRSEEIPHRPLPGSWGSWVTLGNGHGDTR